MVELKDQPTTLMFHAEMIPPIADSVGDAVQSSDPPLAPRGELTAYTTFLASRPPSFETYAISEIISMAHLAPNLPLHIVHLSATECIPLLREARAAGVKITAETCFHYLGIRAEDIEDGDTRHKCCPPIRGARNQDGLWEELLDSKGPEGCIRTVVSDHSPCTPQLKILPDHISRPTFPHSDSGVDMTQAAEDVDEQQLMDVMGHKGKKGDFFAAWGGISSVGLGLPILHTTAIEKGGAKGPPLELTDIVRLCSQETAKQVGLQHRKGGLKVGMDADVCVFDDGEEWIFGRAEMKWKNKCSPWEGKRFLGKVKETWVRGKRVWDGKHIVGEATGQLLLEKRTT
jgi:allantoinase